MKIQSLLYDELLTEHLGNLESVDKELVSLLIGNFRTPSQLQGVGFKKKKEAPDQDLHKTLDVIAKPGYTKSVHSHQTAWGDGSARETNKLYGVLGRNSTLVSAELTFEEADKALKDDPTIAGIIYLDQGKQSLLIVHDRFLVGKDKKASYKDNNSYSVKLTSQIVRKLSAKPLPITSKSNKSVWSELMSLLKVSAQQKVSKLESEVKVNDLFKLLALKDWLEKNPAGATTPRATVLPKLDLLLIKRDTTRTEIHAQRKLMRKGYVPIPKTPVNVKMPGTSYLTSTHNAYVKGLFNSLMYRLNDLKGSRAVKFDEPDKMLEFIIDKGYLKKITFLGEVYNLKDNRINFSSLLSNTKDQREESYVEYEAEHEQEYSAENKAARTEIQELANELKTHAPTDYPRWVTEKLETAESDEKKAKIIDDWATSWAYGAVKAKSASIYMKHKCKPTKIKIILALEGGKIVPFRMHMQYSRYE